MALHVALTVLHVGAIATSLWARPAAAWLGDTTRRVADAWLARGVSLYGLPGGAIVVAIAHVALLQPRFRHASR